ncbi:MAG: chorismate mutase [Bacillota bacterium]
MVRGIRGAVTAAGNNRADILAATGQLLARMIEQNGVALRDIAAVHFSATPDLNAAFPARAAREMGWQTVPLFCHVEIDVPESLPQCIRVLMLVNTELPPEEIKHIYLGETYRLREL